MDLGSKTLYGLDLEEAQKILEGYGEPTYRGRQLLEWLYHRHAESWKEILNLPHSLLAKLNSAFQIKSLSLKEAVPSPHGQSTKFLFETRDGHLLESVLIAQQDRLTICVSTQLGCKMKCVFCASGKSFARSLSAGEIVEQVAWIARQRRVPARPAGGRLRRKQALEKGVTNVVFMGMGEPLDNFEATLKALRILQADWGFGLGARRITVSTVGITPKIEEFVKRTEGKVRLSVSLHTSDEKKRNEIVPINRRYSLKDLTETLGKIYYRRRGAPRGRPSEGGHKARPYVKREITFEYTLMEGINDSEEEARGVLGIAKPLNAKINLIPYNPIREAEFRRPSVKRIESFRAILKRGGLQVTVRQTAGRDIDAACGQLTLDRESNNKEQ